MSDDFKSEIKKAPNSFEQFLLSMDRYINQKYQPKVGGYGWFAGITTFSLFFYFSVLLGMPPKDFAFIIIAVFAISFLFIRVNAWSWGLRLKKDPLTNELVRDPISKEAVRDCGCDLTRLPKFGEDKWMVMRLKEHYTCLIYIFITRSILGWFLMVAIVLVLLLIFK